MSLERFPPKIPSVLTPEQKKGYDVLELATKKYFGSEFTYQRADGAFYGPFTPLIETPHLAEPYCDLVFALAKIPGLSLTGRETVILAINSHYQCKYQIYAHERLALKNTELTLEQITLLKAGKKPLDLDASASVAFDTTIELVKRPGPLRKETWTAMVDVLGQQGTLAVVHYVSFYAYNCMLMNACDMQLPEGEKIW